MSSGLIAVSRQRRLSTPGEARKLLIVTLVMSLLYAGCLEGAELDRGEARVALDTAMTLAKASVRSTYKWFYSEAIALYGGLAVYELTGNREYLDIVRQWADRFARYGENIPTGHVDRDMPALVVLRLYELTGDKRYLVLALTSVNDLVGGKDETDIANHSRFWADDLFMVCPLIALAGRILGDNRYFDIVVNQYEAYEKVLRKPDSGLFRHAQESEYSWGRANGWIAASLVEVLKFLPADYPRRDAVLKLYRDFMRVLARYQDEEGMWHQVIDYPESYAESSSTAMFTYAMAAGVNYRWFETQEEADGFRSRALKGFNALRRRMNREGLIEDVCVGTNARDSLQYYLDRPRVTGDLHGMAPMMWASVEIARLEDGGGGVLSLPDWSR